MWEGWQTFVEHPLTGVGAGQFKNYNPPDRLEPWRETHNVLLQVAAELGVFGLLVFLLLLWQAVSALLWTRRMFSVGKRAARPPPREPGMIPVTEAFRAEERALDADARRRDVREPRRMGRVRAVRVGRLLLDVLLPLRTHRRGAGADDRPHYRGAKGHHASAPAGLAGAGAGMTLRSLAWRTLGAARALDVALTRREGRRSVLIDSRTAMNYIMVAPIQAALAADPRVRFYATSSAASRSAGQDRRGADIRAIYRDALPGTRVISPRAAALKRFDVYLSADLLWARAAARHASRIQMFHGVAGKFQHDYDTPESSMRRWHRFFFVNRRRMRNFVQRRSDRRLERRAATRSACPRWTAWSMARCRRDDVLPWLHLDPASAHDSLRADMVGGLVAEPDGPRARRRAARPILECDRQVARSVTRPAAVLLGRRRLAGSPRTA